MALTAQQMVLAESFTFTQNPDTDSDWSYAMQKAEFTPLGASQSIIQVNGFASGKRTIGGYILADADYMTLEGIYRAGRTVSCVDFLGNAFNVLIDSLVPARVNDIVHGFATRTYHATLIRRP